MELLNWIRLAPRHPQVTHELPVCLPPSPAALNICCSNTTLVNLKPLPPLPGIYLLQFPSTTKAADNWSAQLLVREGSEWGHFRLWYFPVGFLIVLATQSLDSDQG